MPASAPSPPSPEGGQTPAWADRDASSDDCVWRSRASAPTTASPPPGSRCRESARRPRRFPLTESDGRGKTPSPGSAVAHSRLKCARPDSALPRPATSRTAHCSPAALSAAIAARAPTQSSGRARRISRPPIPNPAGPPTARPGWRCNRATPRWGVQNPSNDAAASARATPPAPPAAPDAPPDLAWALRCSCLQASRFVAK